MLRQPALRFKSVVALRNDCAVQRLPQPHRTDAQL
jgi:hypothetical protein